MTTCSAPTLRGASSVSENPALAADYRRLAHHTQGAFLVGPAADSGIEEAFLDLSRGDVAHNATVEVMMGRMLRVPRAAARDSVCLFTFKELCEVNVGASDYLALVSRFHTVLLKGVPVFIQANKSAGFRFVTLIDILYEVR